MEKEWEKFLHVGAVVIEGAEKEALLEQGHVVIPSQWVHVISRSGRAGWRVETLSSRIQILWQETVIFI